MKSKGIYRWLSEVRTQRNPNIMCPSASDVFDDEYEPTASKRRKMSPSETPSVQERQTSSGVSSPTLFTCQSSEYALSVHSSSAPSPQELLSELSSSRPPVFYQGASGIPIPQSIASLRKALLKDFGSKVIPAGLKVCSYTGSAYLYHTSNLTRNRAKSWKLLQNKLHLCRIGPLTTLGPGLLNN